MPGAAGFEGWLFGICRHVVLDAQRAAGRKGYGPPPEPEGRVSTSGWDEEQAAVRAAFARLDDDDRELLELRVVAGLSSEQAAAVLDGARSRTHGSVARPRPPAQEIGGGSVNRDNAQLLEQLGTADEAVDLLKEVERRRGSGGGSDDGDSSGSGSGHD